MERRYLAATLAIVATFMVLSHGFRSLEQIVLLHAQRVREAHQRLQRRSGFPEEAQLLAEMNVPLARAQAQLAAQAAARELASARQTQDTARREAERARGEAMKMRDQMACRAATLPMSFNLAVPADLDRTIRVQTAMLTRKLIRQNLKLQIAAAKAQAVSVDLGNMEPVVSVTESDSDDEAPAAMPQSESDDSTSGRPCPHPAHKSVHVRSGQ